MKTYCDYKFNLVSFLLLKENKGTLGIFLLGVMLFLAFIPPLTNCDYFLAELAKAFAFDALRAIFRVIKS
jgi:hypothetical protein